MIEAAIKDIWERYGSQRYNMLCYVYDMDKECSTTMHANMDELDAIILVKEVVKEFNLDLDCIKYIIEQTSKENL